MATVTKRGDGVIVVSEGEVRVEITMNTRDGSQWLCAAFVGKDWHAGFSGKIYKSDKAALRAAEKWIAARVKQIAEDEASYERAMERERLAGPQPTPAWLEDVFAQLETSDVAEVHEPV